MGIENALKLLTPRLRTAIETCIDINSIDEIRLRLGRQLSVISQGRIQRLSHLAIVGCDDIEYTFKNAFSYSLHCYSKELSEGYITTEGGNRVGLCGTAVIPAQDYACVDSIKYISSINIRIGREVYGYGRLLFERCLVSSPAGVLIIGPPACGKTTLLRDITRLTGSRYKVALIDEMNEISYSHRGFAAMNIGENTDVFVGYPKHIGIRTAVKVMSPQIIVCDEIGTGDDVEALSYALHSGVKIISAIHCTSHDEVLKKRNIVTLLDDKAFDFTAVIDPITRNYEVKELNEAYSLRDNTAVNSDVQQRDL